MWFSRERRRPIKSSSFCGKSSFTWCSLLRPSATRVFPAMEPRMAARLSASTFDGSEEALLWLQRLSSVEFSAWKPCPGEVVTETEPLGVFINAGFDPRRFLDPNIPQVPAGTPAQMETTNVECKLPEQLFLEQGKQAWRFVKNCFEPMLNSTVDGRAVFAIGAHDSFGAIGFSVRYRDDFFSQFKIEMQRYFEGVLPPLTPGSVRVALQAVQPFAAEPSSLVFREFPSAYPSNQSDHALVRLGGEALLVRHPTESAKVILATTPENAARVGGEDWHQARPEDRSSWEICDRFVVLVLLEIPHNLRGCLTIGGFIPVLKFPVRALETERILCPGIWSRVHSPKHDGATALHEERFVRILAATKDDKRLLEEQAQAYGSTAFSTPVVFDFVLETDQDQSWIDLKAFLWGLSPKPRLVVARHEIANDDIFRRLQDSS